MDYYELESKYQKINDNFLYIERLLDELYPLAEEMGIEGFEGNIHNMKSYARNAFSRFQEAYEQKRKELLEEEQ